VVLLRVLLAQVEAAAGRGVKVFVVTFHVHYECGDPIGVAGSIERAKEIVQAHAAGRHPGEQVEWDGPFVYDRSNRRAWAGKVGSDPPWSWDVDEFEVEA